MQFPHVRAVAEMVRLLPRDIQRLRLPLEHLLLRHLGSGGSVGVPAQGTLRGDYRSYGSAVAGTGQPGEAHDVEVAAARPGFVERVAVVNMSRSRRLCGVL